MPESCEEEAETPPVEEPGSEDIFSPESLQSASVVPLSVMT